MLHGLFESGDIIAERFERLVSVGVLVPSLDEIEAGLHGEIKQLYYGLTAKGGERWEVMSKPNWNLYITAGYSIKPNEGEIVAGNPQLVKQALENEPHFGHVLAPGSEVWDELIPWQATYWKTLPRGHRVRFRFQVRELSAPAEAEAALVWWDKTKRAWYTDPFA